MVLNIPRHLNFHQFDQIKVAHYQILWTFIKSVEIKVARYQAQKEYWYRKNIGFDKILVEIKVAIYQIGGNLGGMEQ